jgi:hypothetical protein
LPTTRAPWSLVGGIEPELWQGDIGGAVGAHFGVRASLGRAWSLGVTAGPTLAVGSVDGLHVWLMQAATRLDYDLLAWLRIGAGVTGRVAFVNAGSGEAPGTRTGWLGGALLGARCLLSRGDVVLEVGPDVEILGPPLSVDLDSSQVLRLPVVVAGLAIDVSSR